MYILPMLPMGAVAAAPYLEDIVARRGFRIALAALVAVIGAVFLGAGIAALAGEPRFEANIEGARGLDAASDRLWWLLALAGGAMLLVQLAWRRDAVRGAGAALALLVVVLFSGTAVLLDDENSARAVMQRARVLAGDAELGLVAWKEQNLLQAVGPTAEFGFRRPVDAQLRDGIAWLRERPRSRRLFVLGDAMDDCVLRDRAQRVGTANRRDWYLVGVEAVAARCQVPLRSPQDGLSRRRNPSSIDGFR
jgi:hypothetical protein